MSRVRFAGSIALVAALVLASMGVVSQGPVSAGDHLTIDGLYSETGAIGAGASFDLQVVGRGGVPATGVGAVALNVAVTNPTASSFLTVHPTGAARPHAANLVFDAGQTVPNMVIVKVGAGGRISMFNYGGVTDVVVDVLGWFAEGPTFTALTPARSMDTRPAHPTIDGAFAGGGVVGPADTKTLKVTGRGGVPAAGVGSVALNVTAVEATAASFLTVWPNGAPRPTSANLNYVAGRSVSNMVVAKVGADGQISMFNHAGSAHLVVDVLGWFPEPTPLPDAPRRPTGAAPASFHGLTPARLLDTRPSHPTIDGQASGLGTVGANSILDLSVVERGGVPATAVGAVALNVTVTNPTASSFLTVYPTGAARPTAANLNFVRGQTVPNMVIVRVGAGGRISLYNLAGNVDLVVDVLGWFPEDAGYTGVTPARLMDSRVTRAAAPPIPQPPVTAPPAPTVPPAATIPPPPGPPVPPAPTVPPPPQPGGSAMPIGAASKDWAWFDAAVGPTEIYRNFDIGFQYATWEQTEAHALHPDAPRYDYTFKLPPAEVVAGEWDAELRTFVRSTPANTILSIWHEPEQEIDAGLFTAAAFRAMMVRFKGIVAEANASDGGTRLVSVVLMVSTFTGFKGRDPNTYWPGLAGADLIAVDAYGSPSRTSTTPPGYTNGKNWKTGSQLLTPVYDFAVGKGALWGVSEFGYLVDTTDYDHKAQVIREAIAYARSHGAVMFEYFDNTGSRGDWRLRHDAPPIPSVSMTSPAVLALKAAIAE